MILIIFDILVVALLFMAIVIVVNKIHDMNKANKIQAVIQRQEDAKVARQLIKKLDAEQIKADEAKVQETMEKLQ